MEDKQDSKQEDAGDWRGSQLSIDFLDLCHEAGINIATSPSASTSARSSPLDSVKDVHEKPTEPFITKYTDWRKNTKMPRGVPCLSNSGALPPYPPRRWIDYTEIVPEQSEAHANVPYEAASSGTMPSISEVKDTFALERDEPRSKPMQLPSYLNQENKTGFTGCRKSFAGTAAQEMVPFGRFTNEHDTPQGMPPFSLPADDVIKARRIQEQVKLQQEMGPKRVIPEAMPPLEFVSDVYAPPSTMLPSDIAQAPCYFQMPQDRFAGTAAQEMVPFGRFTNEHDTPQGMPPFSLPADDVIKARRIQEQVKLQQEMGPKRVIPEAMPPLEFVSDVYTPPSTMLPSDITQAPCYFQMSQDGGNSVAGRIHEEFSEDTTYYSQYVSHGWTQEWGQAAVAQEMRPQGDLPQMMAPRVSSTNGNVPERIMMPSAIGEPSQPRYSGIDQDSNRLAAGSGIQGISAAQHFSRATQVSESQGFAAFHQKHKMKQLFFHRLFCLEFHQRELQQLQQQQQGHTQQLPLTPNQQRQMLQMQQQQQLMLIHQEEIKEQQQQQQQQQQQLHLQQQKDKHSLLLQQQDELQEIFQWQLLEDQLVQQQLFSLSSSSSYSSSSSS